MMAVTFSYLLHEKYKNVHVAYFEMSFKTTTYPNVGYSTVARQFMKILSGLSRGSTVSVSKHTVPMEAVTQLNC